MLNTDMVIGIKITLLFDSLNYYMVLINSLKKNKIP